MVNGKKSNVIPEGNYCYTVKEIHEDHIITETCPYWEYHPEHGEQACGYCSYLEFGDFTENGSFLLWDKVKYCGINQEDSF